MILKPSPSSTDNSFGFNLQDYDILKRAFVNTIKPKYPSSNISPNPRYTNNNLRDDFVTSIHGNRVFTYADSWKQIRLLHKQGVLELSLTFATENKLLFKEVRK